MSPKAAWVTLLTKSSYLAGALVLHQSLVSVGTKYPLVVMTTPQLPEGAREIVKKRGIIVRDIDQLQPEDGTHSLAKHDERFGDTWTKLRGFELTEYERIVLLDSDMIVMRNMDELMDLDVPKDWIACSHACTCNPRKLAHYPADWTPENCAHTSVSHPSGLTSPPKILETSPRTYHLLNSGLVVLNPSEELAEGVYNFLRTSPLVPTFSFPDQDLLAAYFKDKWKVLPYCYNALKTLRIIHANLWRDEEIRCLHYILHDKPWTVPPGDAGEYEESHSWWWDRYRKLGEEMKATDVQGWQLVDSFVAKAV